MASDEQIATTRRARERHKTRTKVGPYYLNPWMDHKTLWKESVLQQKGANEACL